MKKVERITVFSCVKIIVIILLQLTVLLQRWGKHCDGQSSITMPFVMDSTADNRSHPVKVLNFPLQGMLLSSLVWIIYLSFEIHIFMLSGYHVGCDLWQFVAGLWLLFPLLLLGAVSIVCGLCPVGADPVSKLIAGGWRCLVSAPMLSFVV